VELRLWKSKPPGSTRGELTRCQQQDEIRERDTVTLYAPLAEGHGGVSILKMVRPSFRKALCTRMRERSREKN
jgi:hypothetical protein